MPAPSFVDRVGAILPLSDTERAALSKLTERERLVRRGTTLVNENDRSTELFVLKTGMMMACVLLDDGNRQILRFVFPGEMLGTATLAYGQARQTLVAVSDSAVAPVERAQIADLALRYPRIGLALTALEQAEATRIAERLAGVSKTPAQARVAAVLLELREQMRRSGVASGDSFIPGLTQEEIGDATGLTAVHVNRMLRQLEEGQLIRRNGGRFTIIDERGLRRAAARTDHGAAVDLSWLPERAG